MKILLIFILSISAYSSCLTDYQNSYDKKISKYNKRMKRYRKNRENATFSRNILTAAIGSKLEPPSKEHIFEEDILRSAGINYEYKTSTVMDIYKKLKPIHPFLTADLVQSEFKQGLSSGVFCKGVFGKYRLAKAKKYVLKALKNKRDIAKVKDINITDDHDRSSKQVGTQSIIVPAYRTESK